jgi:hypothetical protein
MSEWYFMNSSWEIMPSLSVSIALALKCIPPWAKSVDELA